MKSYPFQRRRHACDGPAEVQQHYSAIGVAAGDGGIDCPLVNLGNNPPPLGWTTCTYYSITSKENHAEDSKYRKTVGR